MSHQPNTVYEFGRFRLEVAEQRLRCTQEVIPLPPRAFALLLVLVEQAGHLREKDELLAAVWPDAVVEEVNLANTISLLRKALGEGPHEQRFIETVPRRGYRFVAPVQKYEERAAEPNGIESAPTSAPIVASESTAARFKRWSRQRGLAVSVLILLLGLAGTLSFWPKKSAPVASPTIRTIAVLPFKPLNRSPDDEYLGIGLADAVITRLSVTGKIVVRPTSSVSKYAASTQDPLLAGREQQVDTVLDASLWRAGEKVRVTARLLSVRDGSSLWSYQCEELCTDVFAVQTLISEQIAEKLMPQLTGSERARLTRHYTESREANRLYLQGRFLWNQRTEASLKKAMEYFRQAIEKDPNYALAYAGLAECDASFAGLSYGDPQKYLSEARAYALKALDLDDTLAEAHTTLGGVKVNYDLDWAGSEREYRRALELNAGYATAHQRYSRMLSAMGRRDESLAEIKRALELDPASLMINRDLGAIFFLRRQYDEAIKQLRKTLELEPNFFQAHLTLGAVYVHKKMFAEAFVELNQALALSRDNTLASLGYAYAVSGRQSEAREVLVELQALSKRHYVSSVDMAAIHAGLNEKEQAFFWLEKACQERGYNTSYLKVNPAFDSVQRDPRFTSLLRRIGLTK